MEIQLWDVINRRVDTSITNTAPSPSLMKRYINYAQGQSKERVYWFLKSIIILPSAVMVPTIIWMSMGTDHYIWFVGLCITLFFSNMLAHISEVTSAQFVSLYHISIALMLAIPLITNLMAL